MHLWNQVVIHTDLALRVVLVDVVLECWETKHVAVLKITIILSMLLHSVVGQVHEGIIYVLQVDTELGT